VAKRPTVATAVANRPSNNHEKALPGRPARYAEVV